MAEPQSRKAWLVRWEWAGNSRGRWAAPSPPSSPPRLGGEQVRRAVEMLYASASYTPDEMLRAAQQHGSFQPVPR